LTYGFRDTFDIWDEGSIFVKHQPEDDDAGEELKIITPSYLLRSFYLVPFMPLVAIPVVFFFASHHPIIASSILLGLVGIGLTLSLVSYLVETGNGGKWLRQAWKALTGVFESDELWYLQQEDMEIITCNTDKKPLTYKNLPSKRKTVGLRFQNLKTKVCRPFSL